MLLARLGLVRSALIAVGLCACGIPPQERAGWQDPGSALFTTGPYIVLGPPGTAFIAFKASLAEPPVVDWWVSVKPGTEELARERPLIVSVRARRSADMWIATLGDLPIGPHISYRVRSSRGTTPTYQFRVGVRDGERFRFGAFGDTRTGHDVHRAVVEAVAREQLEFVVNTGDMVERGGIQHQWDGFFQIERPLLVDTPILPAVGNHDFGSRQYFRRYFMHSLWAKGLRYYVHDWGHLRLVAVDGGIECREGCEQYSFARAALEEGAKKGMLMVLFLHYPPYSSGNHGSHEAVQGTITELAKRYGVELVISGHDHNYERTKPIFGTTYIVSGSAGAPIRPVKPRGFTAEARTEPHYVLFDVEKDRIIVRAVNLRGDTFDTYVIDDNPPRID